MPVVWKTVAYEKWEAKLKKRNVVAVARLAVRIQRLANGNPGDAKALGGDLHELRLAHGPGYRVYYLAEGADVILLLAGGDKSTQRNDIQTARALADAWRRERSGQEG